MRGRAATADAPRPSASARHVVLAWLADRIGLARLRGALPPGAEVRSCASAHHLLADLDRLGAVGAVVVEPRDPQGHSTAPIVELLRARWPQVPVLAYCDVSPRGGGGSGDILALARAGVTELVMRGVDDERFALERHLASAARRCALDDAAGDLLQELPPPARTLLRHALERATAPLTIAGVAAALGVTRRTLLRRCARAGLPAPQELFAWCRLLAAAAELERSGASLDRVAHELQFPSGPALRKLVRRHLGMTPTELRAEGALATVLARFRAQLAAAR